MTRLRVVKPYSGEAAGAERARVNPLELISRPIFLSDDGKPLPGYPRWQSPKEKIGGCSPKDFREFYATKPLFVVGGFELIVSLGLVPAWYCEKQTRAEAKSLIKSRKWDKLLADLQGKENSDDDLFGQAAIREFLTFSPPVQRWDHDEREDLEPTSDGRVDLPVATGLDVKKFAHQQMTMRRKHCLRLRKAIEFIVLTEALLRYRFGRGKSLKRFARATGLSESRAYPEVVWDYLWIEPVHYCVSAPARPEDIEAIIRRHDLIDHFREVSGQAPGALYWAIRGVPGKYRTIAAACEVLNLAYAGLAAANVRSVLPSEYKDKMKILDDPAAKLQHQAEVELMPELGPPPRLPHSLVRAG
jgi:hypothetical protein